MLSITSPVCPNERTSNKARRHFADGPEAVIHTRPEPRADKRWGFRITDPQKAEDRRESPAGCPFIHLHQVRPPSLRRFSAFVSYLTCGSLAIG